MMNHFKRKSPWNMDKAFEPMFDEQVVLTSTSGQSITVKCCVFLDNTSDQETDDFISSENESIIVSISRRDYAHLMKFIDCRRGAKLTRFDVDRTYAVQDITEDYLLGPIIKAKTA